MFLSSPLDMCFVSQLERCSYISPHKLIVSYSIFEKIDFGRESLSVIIKLDEDLESKDVKINWSNESTSSRSATWIVKIVLVCFPHHLTLRLNLETRFLFSGGELSYP